MLFEQKDFKILGYELDPSTLEGMTRFPSFYEPFLRLDRSAEKKKRFKCLGERVPIPDVSYTITEKVDGTNCQLIGWKDENGEPHMVVRKRNELSAYSGDQLCDDKEGMVTALRPYLSRIDNYLNSNYPESLWVLGLELYGPGIGKRGKKYCSEHEVRLFSARLFHEPEIKIFMETPREKYDSLRRINRDVPFLPWEKIKDISSACGLRTVPMFGEIAGRAIQTPENAIELLRPYSSSKTAEENGGQVRAEGLVLWSQEDYVHPKEGKVMATFKVKFEDYPKF